MKSCLTLFTVKVLPYLVLVLRTTFRALLYSQTGERFIQQRRVDHQATALGFHVIQFIEGAEEAELGGGVLFSVGERASVSCGPRSRGFFQQENTDGKGQLAIGGNVE